MDKRPKHLNLLKIHLPLPGVLSIFHRISGVILIYVLPFALAALQFSTADKTGYAQVISVASHPVAKLAIWGAAWALFHHLCAGIRFLLLDCHIGTTLEVARRSAAVAFVVSLFLTTVFGFWLW
ncbi:succinate dehydrogenase, cytochrome b556 subunit [Candidatus Persebacteraceae bacterium Df01]|jgi:succinate dehydrogenase / fumarate reductase cytochrome b subunit|uniref:Succinate dehydrogenase cytochrome b556 subunit n=1 Tax=Candidatus Doriopsillibacter californiensis TaxID=2970740 RepID=A0ABT7QN42_9GAMM|nr:succinate dehydrogenase, cytochrome b556 subunit [Candidatus Persebacteraceae bacterium Df01]